MKRLVSSTLLLLASSTAFASAPGGAGCGWGNALFEGQQGPAPHILAATTNSVSTGNNTIGMTFGTNGCNVSGTLSYSGKSMLASVMDEFSEDVAKGEGEALTAISVAMGVQPEDRAHFAQLTHENFNTIFPNQNVTAEQVYNSLQEIMKSDSHLSKYAI